VDALQRARDHLQRVRVPLVGGLSVLARVTSTGSNLEPDDEREEARDPEVDELTGELAFH
jgi:stringent starvation protein B